MFRTAVLCGLVAAALGFLFPLARGWSAEVMPPRPDAYCTDAAHVLSGATVTRLNQELADFERQTSNQLLVVLYPKMESDSSIEDYTVRVAQRWQVGQKGKDNGVVLFIFVNDHRLYLQVGYGLEGALPDVTAKRIVSDVVSPQLRQGDFNGGVTAGVAAIIAATRGEYHGDGTTAATRQEQGQGQGQAIAPWLPWILFFGLIGLTLVRVMSGSGRYYNAAGTSSGGWGSFFGAILGALLGSLGGGRGGEGNSYSGRDDRFSGGGGSFGGGGAGGSW